MEIPAHGKPLLEPKHIEITDGEGKIRHFILSKFDAVEGREIVTNYPIQNMPKIGDYKVSEEIMVKLMSYVAVETGEPGQSKIIRLSNRALINNHVRDWELLAKLEMVMLQYNCSFFRDGSISTLFESIGQMFIKKISEISTLLSEQSSQAAKQHSTN